jgi:hypothetical protein
LNLGSSGGSVSFGSIELDNEDGALDSWLLDVWAGRAISIYLGQVDWPKSSFELVFKGTVDDIVPTARNRLSLMLRDIFGPLNNTLSTAVVGGTGDNKTALMPISLGECFNVSPLLLDAATIKYAVHLNTPIESVIEVRDNGVIAASTPTVANGYFVKTAAVFGQLTCDVQGAKIGGVWRNDAGGLIEWVATVLGDGNFITSGQIDATKLTAFRVACPQPVGLYINQQANRLQVMQQLAASVGATVTATYDGKMILVRVGFGTPVGTINSKQMVDGSFKPLSRPAIQGAIRFNAEKNWTPQPVGLAGSIAAVPANLPIMGDEFVVLSASDATVLSDYMQSAVPPATETLMVVEADINAEAVRLLVLWKVPHTVFGFDGFPECFQYEIGDTVTLIHPRFGLSGVLAQVVGVLHDWVNATVQLEVLV